MSQTPDLSRIVNLIMQNPELIQQISALASTDEKGETAESEVEIAEKEAAASVKEVSAEPHARSSRQELLNAMKPYLSDNRKNAIYSMITIAEILDMMKKK